MTCENLKVRQEVLYNGREQIVYWINRTAADGHHDVEVYDKITGLHTPFDDRPTGLLHALGYEISALKTIEVMETEG